MNRYRVRPARRSGLSLIRLVSILAAVLAFAACGARQVSAPPPTAAPAEDELVILTNDHPDIRSSTTCRAAPAAGGLPARLALVREVRSRHANVLVLDAGDVNRGPPESNLFLGEPDFIGYNAIGYDAMTLGNHEFDAARTVLNEQRAAARSRSSAPTS